MIISTPLRPFTALIGRHEPSVCTKLMMRTAALSTPMLRNHTQTSVAEIERLCSAVFPLIEKVEVIDPDTIHLTFADLIAFTEFRLTDGDELEMVEV